MKTSRRSQPNGKTNLSADEKAEKAPMNLRIGAVSYLNTKPLIYGLQAQLPDADLILDLPSRLADRLSSGDLDVALIPSVEFLRMDNPLIVSDACIACRGPVRSVRLLFRKPPSQVKSLALDEGSRTSAALAQVLLAKRFYLRPELRPFPIDAHLETIDADAMVVIGDRAMQIDSSTYVENWDLGQEWNAEHGLPFVFAMWVTTDHSLAPHVSSALQVCRDQGLRHDAEIAARESAGYGLSLNDCLTYFRNQLHFELGPREVDGLNLFRTHAAELGLIPATSRSLSLEPTC